ncbi:hypothetical protein ACFVUH_14505 [Kitasatospora sp. NPDC058032]|uniref:hypothetical protein n=1 Tax=Kitasatospora sp. NPDC058032 TaxID=3346307 RepID=UPI0036DAEDD1
MTDEPPAPEPPSDPPPEEGGRRKPLGRRIADRWKNLGPAERARLIGVAAAVVGGVIAVAVARGTADDDSDDPDDLDSLDGLEYAYGIAEFTPDFDTADIDVPRWPPYSGPVSGYWRYQCLNPRGHAYGNCEHELRWVDDYTKGPADEPLTVD